MLTRPALLEEAEALQLPGQGGAPLAPLAAVRLVRRRQLRWLLQPTCPESAPLSKWLLRSGAWFARLAQRSQIGRCH